MNDDKAILEHAWRYFQMHAAQRITVFNFFVATSGLLIAGLVFALRGGAQAWTLGLGAGFGLAALAFVFWKLDQRVSSMIKVSEEIIAKIEERAIPDPGLRVIGAERDLTSNSEFGFFSNWTYGQAFRRIFLLVGLVGIGGMAFSIFNALRQEEPTPMPVVEAAGGNETEADRDPSKDVAATDTKQDREAGKLVPGQSGNVDAQLPSPARSR